MRNFLEQFWPLIYIVAAWFVFSSPYFLQNKVPYPSKYQVSFFAPWNQYEKYAGPVKNNAMPDVVDQIYPWKHFTIETFKIGQIPFWNPYSFAGTPHLANYQSAVLSPFNALFFILPFIDAWSLLVLLQPLLAGLFMFLFLRELKISNIGSLIGSVAFMFCGFIVAWMAYGTMAMTIAFLPLTLYCIERCFTKRTLLPSLLLPVSIMASFFSGHVQISFYFALYSFSYLLFKFFSTKNREAFIWTFSFYCLGIIGSSLQILPTFQLYKLAVRSELFSTSNGIPFSHFVTIFAPDFYGNPVTRNDWIGYYAEWATFIGIIPFMLALAAFLVKNNQSKILFFFIAGLVTYILSSNTPLQNLMVQLKLPIFSTSIPSRMIVLFSFSFAVLSGFGLDAFLNAAKEKKARKIFVVLSSVLALLLVIWISLLAFPLFPKDKSMLAAKNLILPSVLFFIFACVVVLIATYRKKKVITALVLVLLFMTTFDSLRFAMKWMPFDPKDLVFPSVPVIEQLKKSIGYERTFGEYGAFVDTYYSIPSIEGYDPLYSKRYGEFVQSANTGEYTNAHRSLVVVDKRGKYTQRLLDVLGVGIIFQAKSHSHQGWAFPVWESPARYPILYEDDKFRLFRNTEVLPRVKLFYNYEVISDNKKIIKRFYSEDFDFRNVLILEEEPGIKVSSSKYKVASKQMENNAKIVSYTPNKVIISVSTEKPALLFLSDSYYPNWKAKVNGKEEKIYRADYTLRSVVVPSGKSTVEFYYRGLL